ncbi:assimilatory nitrate reductase catalytic subunit [Novosphingobium chloroacetimidivorans]|uniref:Assimilatory nitrate reductase catalytic subunit n=1 Tax=Novosphingobium chloroacetimidivorans TaxID=1428314 RepID=A0A7W7KBW6_9SPHN|nr:nitrate reductase [Novosphingobium chloroacetimidivorans]MBB4859994.1 assimilatory nitrate reductase catalytic subunit [Novosphingobium chloroacetimidivorans]
MINTTCAYCGVGCGITATVTGPRSVQIKGDAEHPANHGRLCSKGTHLGETVSLEGRLLHPMIGDNRATWDQALDLVAGRMRDCIAEHGPDSVAFYVSGQLLTEDYYAANKLMKGFVGSANIDTNSRLCMASAVAAHNRAFGEDVVPCSYEDLEEADLILLVGSNTAWCHPVIWQRIEAAREKRGTRLVVIDPRRTETAEQADLYVPVAPDGDVALFNALLAEMRERGLLDEGYLAERVEVDAGFWSELAPYRRPRAGGGPATCGTGQRVDQESGAPACAGATASFAAELARQAGIPAATFTQLADLVAAHPRTVTLFSQGANQSVCGTDKGNAIINLHLATGRINRPGAGPFSITGQPNAMGGREVGGLANMLACHLGFTNDERDAVARFWQAPNICTGPGLKAVDLFRAVHDGRIKFLWVMATNPAVSMPDSGFVREALARCPTVVVSDVIADTDTGRFAHIRLPALAWGEKDGTVTNSERRVSRQRALFAPPGEARADWRIVAQVAERLGWGEHFAWDHPAGVFREFAAMTGLAAERGKVLDLTALANLDDAAYETMAPFQWGGAYPLAHGYPTPSGKARLVSVAPAEPHTDSAYPLRLNTVRYRDQWHTMTRTGLSPTLSQHRPEALLEVHPQDALAQGLSDGGLARVESASGASVFRVRVTATQRPGEICVPMHWTDAMACGARANRLPGQGTDPISGQPGFKNAAARVQPVKPEWRAFVASREAIAPAGLLYWSRSRIPGGWLTELAGEGAVDLGALLPAGERVEVVDVARGMRRIVVQGGDGSLAAALYLTRSGDLPRRDWIAAQLGGGEAHPVELLAGRPSTPMVERGAIVCVCHGVGEKDIAAAFEVGAATVAAIGAATCAGTNCGSCRPAIARLLEACNAREREAAE